MAANLDGVDAEFLKAVYAARDEYKAATGKDIQINSAFRTSEEQAELRKRLGNKAAAPGKSQHEHGFAMDINSAELNEMDNLGILAKHKLIRPVKNEPWHLELAGDRAGRISKSPQSNTQAPTMTTPSPAQQEVNKLATQATANNDAAANALDNILKQHNDVITSAQKTLLGSVEDATLVQQTKDLATVEASRRKLDFATKIGANPDAANEVLSKLIDQTNRLVDERDAVAERIKFGTTPRNLYTNPIRFAADFLLMPQHQQKYNILNKQVENSKNQLKWVNDSTQEFAQTANVMAQAVTTESAAASARMIKRDMDIKIAEMDMQKLKSNSDNILATNRLRNDNLGIALRRRDQEIQEENLVIVRANQKMQSEMLQAQLADKKEAESAKQGFLEAVNLGRETNGELPPFRNYAELDTYMKVNPGQKAAIATQYNAGSAAKILGKTTLAASPHAALSYIAQTGSKLDSGRQPVIDAASAAYKEAATNPENAKLLQNKNTSVDTVNRIVRDKFIAYHADISRGGSSNPYAAPPLAVLLDDTAIGETYFASKILKALHESGIQELPFTSAISTLIKDMNEGKVSMEQVSSELNFIGNKIEFYNNDMRRYSATAGVPNMTQVNVPVNVPTEPGILQLLDQMVSPTAAPTKKISLNLLDPVKVSEFLNKSRAANLKMPVTTSKTGVQ